MIVSVCMITYNHEKYIREAIESVIHQKTDFDFELVIGEDFSTDNTKRICQVYSEKHPQCIRLLNSEKNLGVIPNFIRTLKSCSGKYIAICEGDDYWINPFKLQKQVDFLENNTNYSLCFHDALILWDNKSKSPEYFCPPNQKETSIINDVINNWFVPSASIVFRGIYIKSFPDWLNNIYNGDYALLLLLASKGKLKYVNEVMSVYRKNDGALSAGIGKNYICINDQIIQLLNLFNDYSEFKYNPLIKKKIFKLKRERKYLSIRKKFPIYKYLNMQIWIRKTVDILNNILYKSENGY